MGSQERDMDQWKIGIGKWTNQKAVLPISAGVQLVCRLASHLTGALGVALLSPHNFSPGVAAPCELLGRFAVPEHGAIHVWHLGAFAWVGAAQAELSQTLRLQPMKLPCLSRASMAMVPSTQK